MTGNTQARPGLDRLSTATVGRIEVYVCMAEIDETEVSMLSESIESDHREVDIHVDLDGSDDVETTMDETIEREELGVTAGKQDETDGTLILTESDDYTRISSDSGGLSISYSHVTRLVAQFEYPNRRYNIQVIDHLRLLCKDIIEKLPDVKCVDFSASNIYSIEPPNKEPEKNPNIIFTVTLCKLTRCPEKGLKVQFKPGTGHPVLIGKPSLIPSQKSKKGFF